MRHATLLLLGTLLTLLAGCGDDSTGPELPPLLFLPSESEISSRWGLDVVFQVRTAAGDPYEVDFSVDGEPAGHASVLRWRADRVGRVPVVAVAAAGGRTRTWSWSVQVTEDGLDPLREVRFPEVVRRPEVGVLQVEWTAPLVRTGQPDLTHYEVAWAEGELGPDPFSSAAVETLLHRRGVDYYELRLDGLRPGVEHSFLVRAADDLGRRSPVSPELQAAPVTPFALEGRIRRTDPGGVLQPVAGARVAAPDQTRETLSGADGRFVLEDLVDYLPTPLEAVSYTHLTLPTKRIV